MNRTQSGPAVDDFNPHPTNDVLRPSAGSDGRRGKSGASRSPRQPARVKPARASEGPCARTPRGSDVSTCPQLSIRFRTLLRRGPQRER